MVLTTAIALLPRRLAHPTISVLVNTPSADLFDSREVGALADTLGYGPLFGLLGVFDLVGAAALIVLIGAERRAECFVAA